MFCLSPKYCFFIKKIKVIDFFFTWKFLVFIWIEHGTAKIPVRFYFAVWVPIRRLPFISLTQSHNRSKRKFLQSETVGSCHQNGCPHWRWNLPSRDTDSNWTWKRCPSASSLHQIFFFKNVQAIIYRDHIVRIMRNAPTVSPCGCFSCLSFHSHHPAPLPSRLSWQLPLPPIAQ